MFPAYRGTGGRVTYIADDFHEIKVKIPLSWRSRNYVGTIYGGSMYGAIDPIYMLMLIKILGPEYVVSAGKCSEILIAGYVRVSRDFSNHDLAGNSSAGSHDGGQRQVVDGRLLV